MRSEVSLDLHGSCGVALSQEMSPAATIMGKFGVGAGVGTGVGPFVDPPPQAWRAAALARQSTSAERFRSFIDGEGCRIAVQTGRAVRSGTGRRKWEGRAARRPESLRRSD